MFTNRPAKNNRTVTSSEYDILAEAQTIAGTEQISADAYMIRDRVQRRLLAEADGEVDLSHIPQMHQMIETLFNRVLAEENLLYTRAVRARLLDWVIADILGFGPLEPLLQESTITEVMVNGFDNVYIERYGKVEKTRVTFENETHLMRIIDRIVAPLGRRVDESSPMVDARLPNGYRVNVIIPPLSLIGPMLTIRKFAQTPRPRSGDQPSSTMAR
jgi:pilus assembly protein CpaF